MQDISSPRMAVSAAHLEHTNQSVVTRPVDHVPMALSALDLSIHVLKVMNCLKIYVQFVKADFTNPINPIRCAMSALVTLFATRAHSPVASDQASTRPISHVNRAMKDTIALRFQIRHVQAALCFRIVQVLASSASLGMKSMLPESIVRPVTADFTNLISETALAFPVQIMQFVQLIISCAIRVTSRLEIYVWRLRKEPMADLLTRPIRLLWAEMHGSFHLARSPHC